MVVSPGSLGQKSPSAEFRAAASPARARGMMGLLSDVVLHLTVDHLAPLEYDGGAHISLPATDPRLSIGTLLRWEWENADGALDRLTAKVLAPANHFLSLPGAHDAIARLIQHALLVPLGLMPATATAPLRSLHDALANARAPFRWQQAMAQLLALRGAVVSSAPLTFYRALAAGAEFGAFAFVALDLLRWLQQLLHGARVAAKRTHVRAHRYLAAGCACALLARLHATRCTALERLRHEALSTLARAVHELRIWTGRALGCDAPGGVETPAPLHPSERQMLRDLLLLVYAAHVGRLAWVPAAVAGAAGGAAAALDIAALSRLRPAAAAGGAAPRL